jgi:hypothetical protein
MGKVQAVCLLLKLHAKDSNGISVVPFSLEIIYEIAPFFYAGTG